MGMENENAWEINIVQFLLLIILCVIIFAEKLSLIFDYWNGVISYQLVDGWAEGIKGIVYLIISGIILLSMKYKTHKSDYLAVLVFCVLLFLTLSGLSIYRIYIIAGFSLMMILYIVYSFINKLKKSR